ncbi:hypothetical protein HZR81_22960 [Pseudomonas sp. LM13]
MNAQLENLLAQQLQCMHELRVGAHDLACVVADEVWDKFEAEIEEATADSFMFDMAASTQAALSNILALGYDEAFERHVLSFFDKQLGKLRETGLIQGDFDCGMIDLKGLRKGMKLRRHASDLINQVIERAKPGLIGLLFLSRDPRSESWEREHRDNARRLRSRLYELRGDVVVMMCEETSAVIQAARLAYIDMLERRASGTNAALV